MTWDSTTATRRLAGMPELEPLHPDLAACVVRRPGRLAALEHPLIVQAPYIPPLASYVNGLFETLRTRAATLLANGAYDQWLELHAARFRLRVLVEHASRVDHGAFWELLASLYRRDPPACDAPEGLWVKALGSDKPQRHRFMTRAEQQLFTGLPEQSAVWRIVPDDRAAGAFAHFTTDEAATAVACGALQSAEPPAGAFTLVRGTLAKARVLAALQIHGRVELLALPGSATDEQVVGPVS
jgi:hypothetical protein